MSALEVQEEIEGVPSAEMQVVDRIAEVSGFVSPGLDGGKCRWCTSMVSGPSQTPWPLW